jgi:hypothetical protein
MFFGKLKSWNPHRAWPGNGASLRFRPDAGRQTGGRVPAAEIESRHRIVSVQARADLVRRGRRAFAGAAGIRSPDMDDARGSRQQGRSSPATRPWTSSDVVDLPGSMERG